MDLGKIQINVDEFNKIRSLIHRDFGPADGLSRRDWFAGMALQGVLACGRPNDLSILIDTQLAFKYADRMIIESDKITD